MFGERGRLRRLQRGFRVPVGVEVPRGAVPAYLFNVMNFRSGVEYRIAQAGRSDRQTAERAALLPGRRRVFPCGDQPVHEFLRRIPGGLLQTAQDLVEGSFPVGRKIESDPLRVRRRRVLHPGLIPRNSRRPVSNWPSVFLRPASMHVIARREVASRTWPNQSYQECRKCSTIAS